MGFFNGKTTGHNEKNVRGRGQDFIPCHNSRRTSGLREDILAPGSLNHFRNPMACDVQGREPFDTDHTRAMRDGLEPTVHCIEPIV